jgi:hypothetical protein
VIVAGVDEGLAVAPVVYRQRAGVESQKITRGVASSRGAAG